MTYLYRCSKGHTVELEQRITDKPVRRCKHETKSGTDPLAKLDIVVVCAAPCERVPNNETGFVLKGTGFPGKDGKGR